LTDRPGLHVREAVGVVGGTFDPVHRGHVEIAGHVRHVLGLRRVLLLPTAVPPHKPLAELSPARHRVAMLRLALRGREGLELCELELETRRVCYTIDTLRALRDGPLRVLPLFVLGMDALLQITTWRDGSALLAEFDLVTLDRPHARLEQVRSRLDGRVAERLVPLRADGAGRPAGLEPGRGGRVFHLDLPPIAICSSDIRRRVARGLAIEELVPAAVARYIHRAGLYLTEEPR
jgi:nicotinate-nucleotide adenylyltransferase